MLRLEAGTPRGPRRAGDAPHVSPAAEHFCLARGTLPTEVFSIAFYLLDEVWI